MRLTTAFLMTALALAASSRLALADDDDGPPTASWTAVELNGKPVEGLTLDYTTEKASGSGGCNRFNGPISIEDDVPASSFDALCRLAKMMKITQITIPAAPLGTPFNEEIDRLRSRLAAANFSGIRVSHGSSASCFRPSAIRLRS